MCLYGGKMLRKLRTTWTFLLFIPGAALFGWGYALDESQWTAAHGFASNILAAFTTGFFGVPIAMNILQSILRRDADSRRRRQIMMDAQRTLSAIRVSLESRPIEADGEKLREVADRTAGDLEILLMDSYDPEKFRTERSTSLDSISKLGVLVVPQYHRLGYDEDTYNRLLNRWRFFTQNVMIEAESEAITVIPDWAYAQADKTIVEINRISLAELIHLTLAITTTIDLLTSINPENADDLLQQEYDGIRNLINEIKGLENEITGRTQLHEAISAAEEAVQNAILSE